MTICTPSIASIVTFTPIMFKHEDPAKALWSSSKQTFSRAFYFEA